MLVRNADEAIYLVAHQEQYHVPQFDEDEGTISFTSSEAATSLFCDVLKPLICDSPAPSVEIWNSDGGTRSAAVPLTHWRCENLPSQRIMHGGNAQSPRHWPRFTCDPSWPGPPANLTGDFDLKPDLLGMQGRAIYFGRSCAQRTNTDDRICLKIETELTRCCFNN